MSDKFPETLAMRFSLQSFALLAFLAIPLVIVLGVLAHQLIDPELARGTADYVGTYALLERLRHACLVLSFTLAGGLWFLSFGLLLEARQRSLLWLILAFLGPLGLVAVAVVGRAPAAGGEQAAWPWRLAREAAIFVAVVVLAHFLVYAKNEVWIAWAAASRGVETAVIIAEQMASSGMWAFGEFLQVLFLTGLFYLVYPLVWRRKLT